MWYLHQILFATGLITAGFQASGSPVASDHVLRLGSTTNAANKIIPPRAMNNLPSCKTNPGKGANHPVLPSGLLGYHNGSGQVFNKRAEMALQNNQTLAIRNDGDGDGEGGGSGGQQQWKRINGYVKANPEDGKRVSCFVSLTTTVRKKFGAKADREVDAYPIDPLYSKKACRCGTARDPETAFSIISASTVKEILPDLVKWYWDELSGRSRSQEATLCIWDEERRHDKNPCACNLVPVVQRWKEYAAESEFYQRCGADLDDGSAYMKPGGEPFPEFVVAKTPEN